MGLNEIKSHHINLINYNSDDVIGKDIGFGIIDAVFDGNIFLRNKFNGMGIYFQ